MLARTTPLAPFALCLALACGTTAEPAADSGSTSDDSATTASSTSSASASASASASDDAGSTGTVTTASTAADGSSGTDDGSSGDSGPVGGGECDPFAQDCPEGTKCMPWADDGGGAWNANQCVPVVDGGGQPGDPCNVEGSGVSGVDDCDLGSMCYNVDATTNMGTCYELCSGSPAAPTCPQTNGVCAIYNDGVLPLCLTACDPITQDCPGSQQLCVASPANDGFVCILDSLPGSAGGYGAPCEFANACDPGYFCTPMSFVPGCTNGGGCCTGFCDLDAADPDGQCEGQDGGQICQPWWNGEPAAPGFEHVGYCGLPA